MTTNERNARSLALLAPLACPAVDLLCALYVALCALHARTTGRVIESARADHAARRALRAHRAALLNPVQLPFAPSDYPPLGERDVIPPVLGDDDLIIEPALLRRLAELTADPTCDDVVVTVAACSPVDEPAPECSHVTTDVPGFAPAVDVQHLNYRELQTLCKRRGIKANQSADALRAALIVQAQARLAAGMRLKP